MITINIEKNILKCNVLIYLDKMNNGVDIMDIYNKLYNDLVHHTNKSDKLYCKQHMLNNNDNNNEQIDDYVMIDYLEEDKIDNFLEKIRYNCKDDLTIAFNIKIYINENLKSYEYDKKNIWTQFELDCFRNNIFINNRKVENRSEFIRELKHYKSHALRINKNKISLLTIFAMLSTQSSYAFPYIFLNKMPNYFSNKIVPSNSSNNRKISYEFNKKKREYIKIRIETDFMMRCMISGDELYKVNSVLILETTKIKKNIIVFNNNGLFLLNFM